jgi:hypothetical protein
MPDSPEVSPLKTGEPAVLAGLMRRVESVLPPHPASSTPCKRRLGRNRLLGDSTGPNGVKAGPRGVGSLGLGKSDCAIFSRRATAGPVNAGPPRRSRCPRYAIEIGRRVGRSYAPPDSRPWSVLCSARWQPPQNTMTSLSVALRWSPLNAGLRWTFKLAVDLQRRHACSRCRASSESRRQWRVPRPDSRVRCRRRASLRAVWCAGACSSQRFWPGGQRRPQSQHAFTTMAMVCVRSLRSRAQRFRCCTSRRAPASVSRMRPAAR